MQSQPGWELFKRPFTHYTDKFKVFLAYKFPKVLFLDHALFQELKPEVNGGVCVGCVIGPSHT